MELRIEVKTTKDDVLYTQYVQVSSKKEMDRLVDKVEEFFEELEFPIK